MQLLSSILNTCRQAEKGWGGEGASVYIVYSVGDTRGGGMGSAARLAAKHHPIHSQIQSVLGGSIYNKLLH
jgi:hypothetical protein